MDKFFGLYTEKFVQMLYKFHVKVTKKYGIIHFSLLKLLFKLFFSIRNVYEFKQRIKPASDIVEDPTSVCLFM